MIPPQLLQIHLFAAVLLFCGCEPVNVRLNDANTPLGKGVKNQTYSAVFADVTKPGGPSANSLLLSENAIYPPAQTQSGRVDSDEYFVGVALSGGGSRSANFAAACIFQLERLGLMRHVDYISSVSGGSLTAAYYCAAGDEYWNPGNVQASLSDSFGTDTFLQCLLPWNLAAFTFSDWGRGDVLAGVFTQKLFHRGGRPLTFADLRADRPRLLINAADLQTGRRFVFCNEAFDEINCDLSKYPLSYAVAASSAVPAVLQPITLRDYSTKFPQFRHLIDGGVSDNLGILTLTETYSAQMASASRAGRPNPYPHGAVFVIINAQMRFSAPISDRSALGFFGNIATSLGLTSQNFVARANSATLAETIVANGADKDTLGEVREKIHQLDKEGFVQFSDQNGNPVRVIYISLAQLDTLPNLPFDEFSQIVNHIDTSFDISSAQAFFLYKAADLLVKGKQEKNVREIVHEIETGVAGNPAQGDRSR